MADSAPRRADKRELITEAAIEVFADKGFNHARVSDVAKRAGVADGTIYLYFKNKEDLLLSIFEQKMDELLAGLGEALARTDDPIARVRAFAAFHFRKVQSDRRAAEVMQVELRLSNKFLKEYRPEKLWAYLGVFGQIVREGQARGVFRSDIDPFIGMWAFFGALDELAMQWVLARRAETARARDESRERFPLDLAAEQVAEIFIRGLLSRQDDPRGGSAPRSSPSEPEVVP